MFNDEPQLVPVTKIIRHICTYSKWEAWSHLFISKTCEVHRTTAHLQMSKLRHEEMRWRVQVHAIHKWRSQGFVFAILLLMRLIHLLTHKRVTGRTHRTDYMALMRQSCSAILFSNRLVIVKFWQAELPALVSNSLNIFHIEFLDTSFLASDPNKISDPSCTLDEMTVFPKIVHGQTVSRRAPWPGTQLAESTTQSFCICWDGFVLDPHGLLLIIQSRTPLERTASTTPTSPTLVCLQYDWQWPKL